MVLGITGLLVENWEIMDNELISQSCNNEGASQKKTVTMSKTKDGVRFLRKYQTGTTHWRR